MNTIQVDNENFYSDHIVTKNQKIISSLSVQRFHMKDLKSKIRANSEEARSCSDVFSISILNGPVKIIKLPKFTPPDIPSMNGSEHSYIFQDVNSSYERIKSYTNLDKIDTSQVKDIILKGKSRNPKKRNSNTETTIEERGYHSDENSTSRNK